MLYEVITRGPSKLALKNDLQLIPQWKMEFDVSDDDFFSKTLETAKQSNLPVSRLYYWSNRVILKDNSESGMLLCVPLIASDGTVFGVCGFEVSSMLFKLAYSPSNTEYFRVFATLAPFDTGTLNINAGLVAGNYYMTNHVVNEDLRINVSYNFV